MFLWSGLFLLPLLAVESLAQLPPGPGGPPSQTPVVSSVAPSQGQQGASLSVTVTGRYFAAGAQVSFGAGVSVSSTAYVSATELTASLTIDPTAAPGKRSVTVTNPDSQTGTLTDGFEVTTQAPGPPPAANPTVSAVSPSSAAAGSSLAVSLTGTGFQSGATASFGTGIAVTSTAFVSATELTANLTVEAGASVGSRDVTVTNPDAKSGTLAAGFQVTPPPTGGAPQLTLVNPNQGTQGTTLSVVLVGTGFQQGATVSLGAGVNVGSTVVNSSTQVTASISIPLDAAPGKREVALTNPDTQTATLTDGFEVLASPTQPPAPGPGAADPVVTAVSPDSGKQGAQPQVTLTGTGFAPGATVSFGTGVTAAVAVVNSDTQLTADLVIAAAAAPGARDVTVTNLAAGSGTLTGGFTVIAADLVTQTFPTGPVAVTVPADGFDPAPLLAGGGLLERWNPALTSVPTYAKWEFQPALSGSTAIFTGALERGRGYFRVGAAAPQVVFERPPVQDFEIELTAGQDPFGGWNLVGNPFWRQVNFPQLLARRKGEPAWSTRILQDAAAADIVADYAWGYPVVDSGKFTTNGYQLYSASYPNALTTIPAGAGLWVFAGQDAILRWPAAAASALASTTRAQTEGWLVQLRARIPAARDDFNYFGLGATRAGLRNPPAVPAGPTVDLYFVDAGRGAGASRLAGAVLPVGRAATGKWEFVVDCNQPGETVELSWPDLSAVPSRTRLRLADLATGREVSLRTATGCAFTAAGTPRRFQLTAQFNAHSSLRISSLRVTASRAGLQLSYALSREAGVSLAVLSSAGRKVIQSPLASGTRAGLQRLALALPPRLARGTYLIQVVARAEDGSLAQAVAPLSVR